MALSCRFNTFYPANTHLRSCLSLRHFYRMLRGFVDNSIRYEQPLLGGHHHSEGGHVHDHRDHEHAHHDHDGHDHNHHGHDHHEHEHHEGHDSSLGGLSKEVGGAGGLEGGTGHNHDLSDLLLPLLVMAGFMFFFISERIVRSLTGGGGHSHSHSHGSHAQDDDVSRRKKDDDHASGSAVSSSRSSSSGSNSQLGWGIRLQTAGILNLAADALHNFSDGIAIGAAFASGGGLGYSTALATLLHELPHEIGDFAVLVQNGCTKWEAIGAQFATALAAFAGTAVGLLATQYAGLEQPLLAVTAGGFVYVSCVAVMPDVLSTGNPSFGQGVAEVGAMCAGIALMACVALLE